MSTRFYLACKCGQRTAVATAQAGDTVRCSCGQRLEIPTLQKMRRLPRVPDDEPAAANQGGWGLRQRLMMIGILIAALGLGSFGYFWHQRPRYLPMDDITPAQSFELWGYYRHSIITLTDRERAYLAVREANRKWQIASGSLAAVGLILIAAGFFVPAPPGNKKM